MKLDDETLVSIIRNHRANSYGSESGTVTQERAEALDRYHGRPYGTEQVGWSAEASRD